jgi:hypothetical protein
MATRLATRLRSVFEVDLPLRAIFENPTVRGLAACVEREARAAGRVALHPIEGVPREDGVPLSFAQQRLWFLDQLQPGSAAYNLSAALKLRGNLDVGALHRILQALVDRHEALRTTFGTRAGEPVQWIQKERICDLPVVDLADTPAGEREAKAWSLALREARTPFDLGRGPLQRSVLLRLAADQHLLLVTTHHIVSDGWSLDLLLRELFEYTQAHVERRAPRVPDLGIQYADFAVWQRGWLTGETLKAQRDYWVKKLTGAEQLLLPTDRPRPSARSYRGRLYSFTIPADVAKGARALAQRYGVTFFMVLFGAFNALLYRYSGQTDLVVGTPIANRRRAELEPVVGFFANTLAIRSDLGEAPTFAELLERVRGELLEAYANQDLPFERLVDELGIQRDLSQSPLVQVLFVLNEIPRRRRSSAPSRWSGWGCRRGRRSST